MTVGDLSTLLVWGSATALTIALLAYTFALARQSEMASRAEAPEPVAVGAGAASGPGAGTARASAVDDLPSGDVSKASGIARTTTLLGGLLLLAGIIARGVAAGRSPTANMYEFTLVGVLTAVAVLVLIERKRFIPFVGVIVLGISVLALAFALLVFFIQADAVQPALDSYWLVLHVGVAILATGVFTVAFAAAALQVLKDSRESGRSHLEQPWRRADGLRRALHRWRVTGPAWAWLRTVPSPRALEAQSFRLNAIGFVGWTFALVGGAIWAEHAWGRYWGWDPKEVGTFVAWVVYAAYLHARTTRGWSGRRAAYFVFVGYAAVIANFTVVNLIPNGLHSYSGL